MVDSVHRRQRHPLRQVSDVALRTICFFLFESIATSGVLKKEDQFGAIFSSTGGDALKENFNFFTEKKSAARVATTGSRIHSELSATLVKKTAIKPLQMKYL